MVSKTNGARSKSEFEWLDSQPKAIRQCCHEYGVSIVRVCMSVGVRDARQIHNLVREIWDGARHARQRNNNGRAARHAAVDVIDWILINSNSELNSDSLVRSLWERNLVIVPREPDPAMVAASLEEVSGFNIRCTKEQKHRLRLRAGIEASARSLWPDAFRDSLTNRGCK